MDCERRPDSRSPRNRLTKGSFDAATLDDLISVPASVGRSPQAIPSAWREFLS